MPRPSRCSQPTPLFARRRCPGGECRGPQGPVRPHRRNLAARGRHLARRARRARRRAPLRRSRLRGAAPRTRDRAASRVGADGATRLSTTLSDCIPALTSFTSALPPANWWSSTRWPRLIETDLISTARTYSRTASRCPSGRPTGGSTGRSRTTVASPPHGPPTAPWQSPECAVDLARRSRGPLQIAAGHAGRRRGLAGTPGGPVFEGRLVFGAARAKRYRPIKWWTCRHGLGRDDKASAPAGYPDRAGGGRGWHPS